MVLSKETWEIIVESLQEECSRLRNLIVARDEQYEDLSRSNDTIRSDYVKSLNEIADLRLKLRQYEKADKVEHFIKMMSRTYSGTAEGTSADPAVRLRTARKQTWASLFYSLYPLADEQEYMKRGKAKDAIIALLRSGELQFNEQGVIYKCL
jgi:hypothetical protein